MGDDDSENEDLALNEGIGGFEMFQRRASDLDRGADPNWRVGFDPRFRLGLEEGVAKAVISQLDVRPFPAERPGVLVDIGGGASPITDSLTLELAKFNCRHVVIDGHAMVAHLSSYPSRHIVPGRFPDVLMSPLWNAGQVDHVLVYSVLQYVIRDMSMESFMMGLVSVATNARSGMLGDLPNRDKRDRRLRRENLPVPPGAPISELRDGSVIALLKFLREHGFDSYVFPQQAEEPMWRHRENIIFYGPSSLQLGETE